MNWELHTDAAHQQMMGVKYPFSYSFGITENYRHSAMHHENQQFQLDKLTNRHQITKTTLRITLTGWCHNTAPTNDHYWISTIMIIVKLSVSNLVLQSSKSAYSHSAQIQCYQKSYCFDFFGKTGLWKFRP